MKRFKNILIVCDAADNLDGVLDRGLWLALANAARVTLIDVQEAPAEGLMQRLAGLGADRSATIAAEMEAGMEAERRTRIEALAARFREAGLPVETVLASGHIFIAAIRKVLQDGYDLVLKGAGARQGRALFASEDMHLMRKCPCPVWILKADLPPRAQRILAAVDPESEDPQNMALNTSVMELATSLAAGDEAELHVIHVWRLQEESALRTGRYTMSEGEIASILQVEQDRHDRALQALLAAFPEAHPHVALVKGLPGEVIPAHAHDIGIDTIVMGTIGRTGIAGFFVGNTAETILSSVECSVLAVKPPGFRSPLADVA